MGQLISVCVCVCVCVGCSVVSSSLRPMNRLHSVHGILQARILERVAMPFSRGPSQPRGWTWVFCIAGTDSLLSEPQGKPSVHQRGPQTEWAALQPDSGVFFKESSEWRPSWWAEFQAVPLVIYMCEERNVWVMVSQRVEQILLGLTKLLGGE